MKVALAVSLAAALATAAPAHAGDPIMPLSEVQRGMQCEARTVIQGVDITTFGAEVVDVVSGDTATEAPRILFRFSGEAIERTGVGPGFSGSPIYCDGRVAGAISESVGEYGGTMALATPIEPILGQPVEPPPGTRPASQTPARSARALSAPISMGGLSPRVANVFTRAAARAKRVLYAAPGRPVAESFPWQQLRPGSAMAVGLASGDITAGSVGTVTYVDERRVWAFGHPLDAAGRRSLFLQDAYVYAVVNNPVQVEGVTTYKLAVPGHNVGILTGDGLSAVAGTLGNLPPRFPMKVVAQDLDTGRQSVANVEIADENALDLPTGSSSLSFVGAGAVAQAGTTVLGGGAPARQTGEMCARIHLRESPKPLRFCNRYVTRGGGGGFEEGGALGVAGPMAGDFVEAVTQLDEYNFAALTVTNVEVNLKVRRGLRQAFLIKATGPDVVRRGRTARIRVRIQQVRGPAETRTIRVRVPRAMPSGPRELLLQGTPTDEEGDLEIDLSELLFGADEDDPDAESTAETGPRTVAALAKSIKRIARYDGVTASFLPPDDDTSLEELGEDPDGPEGIARRERRVYKDPELRLSGSVRVPIFVR